MGEIHEFVQKIFDSVAKKFFFVAKFTEVRKKLRIKDSTNVYRHFKNIFPLPPNIKVLWTSNYKNLIMSGSSSLNIEILLKSSCRKSFNSLHVFYGFLHNNKKGARWLTISSLSILWLFRNLLCLWIRHRDFKTLALSLAKVLVAF